MINRYTEIMLKISYKSTQPKRLLAFAVTLLVGLMASSGALAQYCLPEYSSPCGADYIADVQFSTVSNFSNACSGGLPNNHTFFSGQPATVTPGQTYTLTVQNGPQYASWISVWFDWNGDNDFADAGEYFNFSSQVAAGATANINVTVPLGATPGTSRMRIMGNFSWQPLASDYCAGPSLLDFGETEDYPLNIVPATPSNDDPCSAQLLPIQDIPAFVTTTNLNATPTTGQSTSSCGNYAGGDVWYEVYVPSSGDLRLRLQDAGIGDAAMAVYTGNCSGTLSELDCADDINGLMPEIDVTGLVPGLRLYIRVWGDGGSTGDFSIQAEPLLPGASPITGNTLQDFEPYAQCGSNCGANSCLLAPTSVDWFQVQDIDDIDFEIDQGGTPSTNTGPSGGFNATAQYLFTEASACFSQEAMLISAPIEMSAFSGELTLNFGYHMFGTDIGGLALDVEIDGNWVYDVWQRSGAQGNVWFSGSHTVFAPVGSTVRLRFRAITGTGFASDIAIDELSIENTCSNPLSGNYSLGPSGDFQSFDEAFQALGNCGISGPVTINVQPGSYTEVVDFAGPIPAATATDTVVFRGVTGIPIDAQWQAASTFASPFVLRLTNTEHLTFRHLQFTRTGAGPNTGLVRAQDCSHLRFENIEFLGNGSSGGTLVEVDNASIPGVGVEFLTSNFIGLGTQLRLDGISGNNSQEFVVEENNFSGFFTRALTARYQDALTVEGNIFNSSNSVISAIELVNGGIGSDVVANEICLGVTQFGILLNSFAGTVGDELVVANNMISANNGGGKVVGLNITDGDHTKLAYNTITVESGSNTSYCYFQQGATPSGFIDIFNNLFQVQSGAALTIGSDVNNAGSYNVFDYNVFFTAGPQIGFWQQTGQSNLSDIIGVTGQNTNSLEYQVTFNGTCDLTTNDPTIDGLGTPDPDVTEDKQGDPRDPSTPDPGADEFGDQDIGVVAIGNYLEPDCPGSHPVRVIVENFGNFTTNSFDLGHSIDGVPQPVVSWAGNLLPGDTVEVWLPATSFSAVTGVEIQAATDLPNNQADINNGNNSFTQPDIFAGMSGNYTIGASGDYPDYVSAYNDLQNRGQCGLVNFVLQYASHTEHVAWDGNLIRGHSYDQPIILSSASANPANHELNFPANTSDFGVLELDNIYVQVEDLTITRTGSFTTFNNVVFARGSIQRFENCVFDNTTANGTAIFASDEIDSLVVENCEFLNSAEGIEINTPGLNFVDYLRVSNSYFTGQQSLALVADGLGDMDFEDNIIFYPTGITGTAAVRSFSAPSGVRQHIQRNEIVVQDAGGIDLSNMLSPGTDVLIANNSVSITGTGIADAGIVLDGVGNSPLLLHNSVNIHNSTSIALLLQGSQSVEFFNNILANYANGEVLSVNPGNSSSVQNSDNNLYYTAGGVFGQWGANILNSLADYQFFSSYGANSLSGDPAFASSTSTVPVNPNSPANDAGVNTFAASFPLDLDGQVRSFITPDIGAYEFGCSGPLTGTYTLGGTSPDFTSFQMAENYLSGCGIDGDVLINVRDGVYDERVVFDGYARANPDDWVTIRSEAQNFNNVVLQQPSSTGSTDNFTLKIDGTENLAIEHISIQRTGPNQYSSVLELNDDITGFAPDSVRFRGCRFFADAAPPSSFDANHVVAPLGTIGPTEFDSCLFVGNAYAFRFPNNLVTDPLPRITRNTFLDQSAYAAYFEGGEDLYFAGNTIENGSATPNGLACLNCVIDTIAANVIEFQDGGIGILLDNAAGAGISDPGVVVNNAITINATTTGNYGIQLQNQIDDLEFFFNTVNTYGFGGASFPVYMLITGGAGNILEGNIFSNYTSAEALAVTTDAVNSIDFAEHNVYHTTGATLAAIDGTPENTLRDWQDATFLDALSIERDPFYVSNTDLNLTLQSPVIQFVPNVLGVQTDLEGTSRDGYNTDPGAYVVNCASAPLAGSYTVGGASPDYTTIQEAANALMVCGVSGPVFMNIRDGVYNEHIQLGEIPGASPTDTVVFQSENLDSSLVTLRFPESLVQAESGILNLKGTGHTIFRHLTFERTGSGTADFGLCVDFADSTNNIRLYNNHYMGISGVGFLEYSAIYSFDYLNHNTYIANSLFENGYAGVSLSGDILSFTNEEGNAIINNEFTGFEFAGIDLTYQRGFTVERNEIDMNVANFFVGINILDAEAIAGQPARVENNYIRSLGYHGEGISLDFSFGSVAERILVANNRIYLDGGPGDNIGLYIGEVDNVDFVFNSILIAGNNTAISTAVEVAGSGSGLNNTLQNNNLLAFAGPGVVFSKPFATSTDFSVSDYNNFYHYGGGDIIDWEGTFYSTVAAYNGATSNDPNSLDINPQLSVGSSLTLLAITPLAGAGTPIAAVTEDYEGELRDASAPTIGADERNSCAGFEADIVSFSEPLCTGGNTGEVTLGNIGGTGPYTYSDDNITFGPANTFTGLSAGSYVFYVEDGNGCVDDTSITLNDPPALSVMVANQIDVTCNGGSDGEVLLMGSGGTGTLEYSADGTNFQPSTAFPGLSAGAYTFTVRDGNGCTAVTNTNVGEPAPINATITTSDPLCVGSSDGSLEITLTTGGTAPYEYSVDGSPFGPTTNYTGLSAATYSVTVQDVNGCTFNTSATLNDPPALSVMVANQIDVSCNGGSDGEVLLMGSGGTGTLEYSADGTNFQPSTAFPGLSAGAYTFTVRDGNGCTAVTNTNVGEPAPINATITTSDPLCVGSSDGSLEITLTTGGTAPYQYSVDGSPFSPTTNYTGLSAATYSVAVQDVNGCTFNTSATLNDPPALSVMVANQIDVSCNGGSDGEVLLMGTGGTGTLEYSADGTNFQPSTAFPGLSAGAYTFTVRDGNGCTAVTNTNVGEPAPINATITTSDPLCVGSSDGSLEITLTTGGTAPYEYSVDGSPFGPTTNYTGLSAATYSVAVQDVSGCTFNTSATLNDPPALSVMVANQIDVSCNGGSDGEVLLMGTGGTGTLEYSADGTNFQPSTAFPGLSAGAYTFTVRDGNGCTAVTNTNVGEPAPINATITTSDPLCVGSSDGSLEITLTTGGTAPYEYSVDGSPFGPTTNYTGLSAATYSVAVQDVNGCTFNTSATLNDPPALSVMVANQIDVSCNGGSNGEVLLMGTGGTGTLEYSADGTNFQPSTAFTGLSAGVYTFTVRDGNGCTAVTNTTITEPAVLQGSYTVGGASPDYPTLQDAFDNLMQCGIAGNVFLNIRSGTYAWGPDTLGAVAGSGPAARIYIQSEVGDSSQVTLTAPNDPGVILLDAAEWVVIREITLENTDPTGSPALELQNGASNLVVELCQLSSELVPGSDEPVINADGSAFVNDTIRNSLLVGGAGIGFFLGGQGGGGHLVENNEIVDFLGEGINVENQSSFHLRHNTLEGRLGTSSIDQIGIYLWNVVDALVEANRVEIPSGTNNNTRGLHLRNTGSATDTTRVFNNYFYVEGGNAPTSAEVLRLASDFPTFFYFNTAVMPTSAAGTVRGTYVPVVNNADFISLNNNFSLAAPATVVYDFELVPTKGTGNGNNYHLPNGGNIGQVAGTPYPTLAAWRAASNSEALSLTVDPFLIGNGPDIQGNSPLEGQAVAVGFVPANDLNRSPRSFPNDIGAVEFDCAAGTAPAVTLVGGSGNLCPGDTATYEFTGGYNVQWMTGDTSQQTDVWWEGNVFAISNADLGCPDTSAVLNTTITDLNEFVTRWDSGYGGSGFNQLVKVLPLEGGSEFLLAGYSNSPVSGDKTLPALSGTMDAWLLRTDSLGAVLQDYRFGGNGTDELSDMIATSDGGYLMAITSFSGATGEKTVPNLGNSDIWLVKLDASFTIQWQEALGGIGPDYDGKLYETPAGDFVVAATSASPTVNTATNNGLEDVLIARYNSGGALQSTAFLGGSGSERIGDIAIWEGVGIAVGATSNSGTTGNKTSPAYGGEDFWLLVLDDEANLIGQQSFGGDQDDEVRALQGTFGGRLILLGNSASAQGTGTKTAQHYGDDDYYAVVINRLNQIATDLSFGGSGNDRAIKLVRGLDEQTVGIVGNSSSPVSGNKTAAPLGGQDVWFVSYDPNNGTVLEDHVLGGNNNDFISSGFSVAEGGYLFGITTFSPDGPTKSEPLNGTLDYYLYRIQGIPAEALDSSLCKGDQAELTTTVSASEYRVNQLAWQPGLPVAVGPITADSANFVLQARSNGCEFASNGVPVLANPPIRKVLWQEDFSSAENWQLNVPGTIINPLLTNSAAPNQWVVNNDGSPELSPIDGNYLHINCSSTFCNLFVLGAPAVYDAGEESNQLALLEFDFPPTLFNASEEYELAFDWAGFGEIGDDYGELLYSVDGGLSWQAYTGATYSGANEWRYEAIDLNSTEFPGFVLGSTPIRFGFRWQNDDDNLGQDPSFSVDNLRLLQVPTRIAGPQTVCADEVANYTALDVTGPANYTWNVTGAVGNVVSGNDLENAVTWGATGSGSVELEIARLNACTVNLSEPITIEDGVQMEISAWLEGPYNSGANLMNTDLNTGGNTYLDDRYLSGNQGDTVQLPVTGTAPEQGACLGYVVDDGGPFGRYSNGADNAVVLRPAGADSVYLYFEIFSTFSADDSLRVIQGANPGDPVVGTYSANNVPSGNVLVVPGGEVRLEFRSNALGRRTGFVLRWESNNGCQGILPHTASVPANAVDLVTVELRDPVTPSSVLATENAWLLEDGTLESFGNNGVSVIRSCPASNGNYNVALQHRNHLGVITAAPVSLTSATPTTLNFKLTANLLGTGYQLNTNTEAMLTAGNAFDASFDTGEVNAMDFFQVWFDQNTLEEGYLPTDINLDGVVNAADFVKTQEHNDNLESTDVPN